MTLGAPARSASDRIRAATADCRTVAEEHATRHDATSTFPLEALEELRQSGLLGVMVPERHGGLGGTIGDLVRTTMELGRADASVAMVFAMHCQQVAAIARFGSPQLRDSVLPAIAAGELYLGSVTTEPGGTGTLACATEPLGLDDELLLQRDAPFVTGGRFADAFLVTMRTPAAGSSDGVDLVFATRAQLRVEVLGEWHAMGTRATDTVALQLQGVVPAWQVVGGAGAFRRILAELFGPMAHVGWCATWLGTAAGACSRLLRFARTPEGRRRIDHASELVLARLADVRAKLDATNALLWHTVGLLESSEDIGAAPAQLLVNALKVTSADACKAAADELMEIAGLRFGYRSDSPLGIERALRDLRSASLNFHNDRLRVVNGRLALMDPGVHLA